MTGTRSSRRGASHLLPPCVAALCLLLAASAGVMGIQAKNPHRSRLASWEEERFPRVRDVSAVNKLMMSLSGLRVSTHILGTVDYGPSHYPIVGVSIEPLAAAGNSARILIIAGIHGHEVAGPEAAIRFAVEMSRDPDRYPSASLDVIPITNPWGWSRNVRYNGAGEDINRDFASRRTQEGALLRDFMRAGGPYDLVLDLHESKKPGYFVYDYSWGRPGYANAFRRVAALSAASFETGYREGGAAVRDGVLSISMPVVRLLELAGRLSIDGYARLFHSDQVYVVETPLSAPFSTRLQVHSRSIRAFVEAVLGITRRP